MGTNRQSTYKYEINENIKDNKRDIIIIDRHKTKTNNKTIKNYKYKCNICGWTGGLKKEESLLNGTGCACCTNQIVVEGINDIPTTASWMVKYFQGGYDEAKLYTKGSSKKIYPICPDCGKIKDKEFKISQIYNQGYLSCMCRDGISYPEKLMFNVLESLNIKFKYQYNPKWAKRRIYDFYFISNNKEYIIETDGAFHHGDAVIIDEMKDKMAKLNNITVIRINCVESNLEFIKNNILNSELANLFDLSLVDWVECETRSLSNIIKEVCLYQSKNENATSNDIALKFKLSVATIRSYLKKGETVGWCKYYIEQNLFDNDDTIKNNKNSRRKKYTKAQIKSMKDNVIRSNEIFTRYGLEYIKENLEDK